MKIANETNVVIGLLLTSQFVAMNAAAPDGTPPRRVNNRKHLKNTKTAPPCPGGALRRGTLISAIFTIPL